MSLSVHQASVGVYGVGLNAFQGILDKAAAHAAARKFDPSVYLTQRLRPDMLAFPRQVQAFCDNAKATSARLAGVQPPVYEDNEASLDELKARIRKTLDFMSSLDAKAIDASADREIVFPLGPNKMKMLGGELSAALRAAELLFPPDDGLRHLALCRRRDRQARLPRRRSRHRSGLTAIDTAKANSMTIDRIGVGPRMSQAVVHGDTIYLAGQVADKRRARASASRRRKSSTIIDALLAKAGSDKTQILSATIYLADIKTFAEMNAVWDAWVPQGHTPARATVEAKLAAPQYTVEIACIAAKPAQGDAARRTRSCERRVCRSDLRQSRRPPTAAGRSARASATRGGAALRRRARTVPRDGVPPRPDDARAIPLSAPARRPIAPTARRRQRARLRQILRPRASIRRR